MARAKRETRDEAIQRAGREGERATLNGTALDAILGNEPITTFRASGDSTGMQYVYRMVRPTGAHGGIVAVTFRCNGQKDSTAARYLDELYGEYRNAARLGIESYTPAMQSAVQSLVIARQQAWDAAA